MGAGGVVPFARHVALDTSPDVREPSGDSSFLHELALLDHPVLSFEMGSRARWYPLRRLLVGSADRLSQLAPVAGVRVAALRTARSIRLANAPPAEITLSHISCPRPKRDSLAIWSSQGISSPAYYRAVNRRISVEDVTRLYDSLGGRAHRIVVWGATGGDRVRRRCPSLAHKVWVIPPPIVDRRVETHAAPPALRFIFVGGDWRRKRLPDLLTAFRAVARAEPHATLDVVAGRDAPGSGQAGVRLHASTERHNVLTLMQQSNVLVLPSGAESYGLVVAEALMMGLACVISDTEPLPEIAGAAGLVFRVGDPLHLEEQLVRLATDPSLVTELQRRARERYLAEHHPDVFVARFLACLS